MLLQCGQNGLLFVVDNGEWRVLVCTTGYVQLWWGSGSILSPLANDYRMLLFILARLLLLLLLLLMNGVDDIDRLIGAVRRWSSGDAILGDVSVQGG